MIRGVMLNTLRRFATHDLLITTCSGALRAFCGPTKMLMQHCKQIKLEYSVSDARQSYTDQKMATE